MCNCPACSALPAHPHVPGKHINPATSIPSTHEWGDECARGWASNARFARGPQDSVIKRADRGKTKKVYQAKARQEGLA